MTRTKTEKSEPVNAKNLSVLDRPIDPSDKKYIETLDGWRAIAIALVLGAHSVPMLRNSHSKAGEVLSSLFSHAGYGVDIFFAMSGFLIPTLLLREKDSRETIDITGFYIRRFFRIVPPILCYLLFVLALYYIGYLRDVTSPEIVSSIFFLRNYFDGSWYTGHFWSLSIEEHFYAIAPLLILFLSSRKLVVTYFSIIVLCVLIRLFEFSHADYFQPLPQFRTENRVDALLWGSICAFLFHSIKYRERLKAILTGPVVLTLAICTAVASFAIEDQAFRRTIMAFTLPLLIFYTVLNPQSIAGKILELRFLRLIGRMSYSIYIWQMPFLVPLERPLGSVQTFPIAFFVIAIAATTSYWLIEKPMIRVGHRITAVRRKRLASRELAV